MGKKKTTDDSGAVPGTLGRSVFFHRPEHASTAERVGWFWAGVWLPAALACMVIATESTATFSANHTSGWLRPIFERLLGPISDEHWWWAHHLFRKSGHFLGYGLVGLAFLRAWLLTFAPMPLPDFSWRLRCLALGVFSAFCVASLDEYHQTFLPSRTGGIADVLLDTCGAVLLCGVVTLVGLQIARRQLAARKIM